MPFLANPAPIPLGKYERCTKGKGLNKIATATAGLTVASSVFIAPASKAAPKASLSMSTPLEKAPTMSAAQTPTQSESPAQVDWTLFFKSLRAV